MIFNKLIDLKNKGYNPDAILDIGAHKGWWTDSMRQIYNDCKYYLFEPTNYSELEHFKYDKNIRIFNVILNEKIEEVEWYQINGTGDSFFKEKSFHYANCNPVKKQTIDLNTIISQNNILNDEKHILIKLDCQGSELAILKGSTNILNKTDFIILEVPFFGEYNLNAPNFLECITFMNSIEFIPFDILENHYINGFNLQVDILFINKNHIFNTIVNEKLL